MFPVVFPGVFPVVFLGVFMAIDCLLRVVVLPNLRSMHVAEKGD
jgi:hypothetical protein